MAILHDAAGQHCWITVQTTFGISILVLDGHEVGAMWHSSERPVYYYLWFHKCSWLAEPPVRRCLVLGAGIFTAAKCLALDHPEAQVDTVDIEPELEPIARKYYRLNRPEFHKIVFHGQPAEEFMASRPEPYDFIFDDMFKNRDHVPSADGAPEHFQQLQRLMKPGGVLLKNVIWNPRIPTAQMSCEAAIKALSDNFPTHYVIAFGEAEQSHNRLLLGINATVTDDWPTILERLVEAGANEAILLRSNIVKL